VAFPVGLFAKLRNDELDLAFVALPQLPPEDLHFRPLQTYPMMLACPLGHRLAQRRDVTLAMLADEIFVDFDPVLGARQITD